MSVPEDGKLSGRKPRKSRQAAIARQDQVREQMLNKAQEMVERAGLGVSLGHIQFEDIQQQAGVPRTAAYRAWKSKDEFLARLLIRLAGETNPGSAAFDEETIRLAAKVADEYRDKLDTREGRYQAVVEVCRQAAWRNFITIAGSPTWKTYVALIATLESNKNEEFGKQLRDTLEQAEWKFVNTMKSFYSTMADILGFRVRKEIDDGFQTVAQMCAALVEGLALLGEVMPNIRNVDPSDPFRVGVNKWSMPSIGVVSLLLGLIEEIPEDEYDVVASRTQLDAYLAALEIAS